MDYCQAPADELGTGGREPALGPQRQAPVWKADYRPNGLLLAMMERIVRFRIRLRNKARLIFVRASWFLICDSRCA